MTLPVWLRIAALAIAAIGCDSRPPSLAVIDADFETGSIGVIERTGSHHWDLHLRDDNDDADLPERFRSWWYVRLRDVEPGEPISLTIRNRGWAVYYVPVYSYEGVTWHRFEESEVRNGGGCAFGPSDCTLEITSRFSASTVYIARFYPYTVRDLETYLEGIATEPYVEIRALGASPFFGRDIPIVRVSHPDAAADEQHAVWIHARTHPGETAASFMVEGAIDQLLYDLHAGDPVARHLVYYVVPMHNVDGVLAGNSRTDTRSRNLEVEWHIDPDDAGLLIEEAPLENRLLNAEMSLLANASPYPGEIIALNLHASNTAPLVPPFAFPHFGPEPRYDTSEQTLWNRQVALLERVRDHFPDPFVAPTDAEGGAGFLDFAFPETWWWWNRGSDAVALTIEAVYGKPAGDWVTPEAVRELGASLTLAIYDHHFPPEGGSRSEVEMRSPADSWPPRTLRLPTEIETKN